MQLNEKLEQIDRLKTDKYMQILLLAIRSMGELDSVADRVLVKHKAKNPTINKKMASFKTDLIEEYDYSFGKFYDVVIRNICGFIGEERIYVVDEYLFDYSLGGMTIDELIVKLKEEVRLDQ